jgi:hypothetical protein
MTGGAALFLRELAIPRYCFTHALSHICRLLTGLLSPNHSSSAELDWCVRDELPLDLAPVLKVDPFVGSYSPLIFEPSSNCPDSG